MTPEDLVEMELIKRLKYRYLRCLDQKLWDEIETCFLPDATARYGGGLYEFEGRDAIMEFLRTSMGATTMLSSHRCHHPEIDPHRAGRGHRHLGPRGHGHPHRLRDQRAGGGVLRRPLRQGRRHMVHRPHRLPAHLRGDHPPGLDRRA